MISESSKLKPVAIAFVICLVLFFIGSHVPGKITTLITALALLGACGTGWIILFEGATLISHRLEGEARRNFNYAVTIIAPAIASLFFLHGVPTFSFHDAFESLVSPWAWLMFLILGAICWGGAAQIDSEHFLRGFIIVATALWVIHAVPAGTWSSDDDEDTYSSDEPDNNPLHHFGDYIIQVTVSYGAMMLSLRRIKK